MSEPTPAATRERRLTAFLPLCLTVFCTYAVLGLSLAAVPTYVHDALAFGNVVVGVAIGVQSVAALLTRHFAGTIADLRGARTAVWCGVVASTAASALALGATLPATAGGSLALLMVARAVLGLGESLLVTGCLSWGIALVGPKLSGRVMAWNGIAMYTAIAAAAPLASPLVHAFGIRGVFAASLALPVIGSLFTLAVAATPALGTARTPFYEVIRAVWRPGAGLALAAVGFGGIASFISLDFAAHGWSGAPLVLTVFGGCYVAVRACLAHLPDRLGGARVALVSLLVQLAGQLALWLAPSREVALAGAALIGAGFSLVFPAFGVEAIRRVAPTSRGAALGAYVAFFDLALGATAPICGTIANHAGYEDIFLFGAACSALAAVLAFRLRARAGAGAGGGGSR